MVQLVSCVPLNEGRSDSFIVTLANAGHAAEARKSLLEEGIKLEHITGQLVYRPTKSSKLTDNY